MSAGQSNSPWQDRITHIGRAAPDALTLNPRNWRTHPGEQQDALIAALDHIGWVAPVIVNETTGNVIDGHLRIELAIKAGVSEVPVAYVSLTEEEEAEALLTLDSVTGMAGVDEAAFDELLREVGSLGPSLDAMLAEVAANAGLYEARAEQAVPPADFNSYDEDIETEYCCPKCGYEWSGRPR